MIPSYPEGHPLHCSLCRERWQDPVQRERARRRIVEMAAAKVSVDHAELFASLADYDTKAEGGKA